MLTHEFSLPSSDFDSELPEAIVQELRAELARTLPALLHPLEVALGLGEPTDPEWIIRANTCVCATGNSATWPCAPALAGCRRVMKSEEITSEGRWVTTIFACGQAEDVTAAALATAVALGRRVVAERDNLSLVEELSVSWESLATVYEISSVLQTKYVPRVVLRQILDRAIQIQPGMQGVLWLVEDDEYVPVATRTSQPVTTMSMTEGLLGQLLPTPRLMVINRRGRTAELQGPTEAIFQHASAIALIPLVSHFRMLGALAVWFEEAGHRIDSKITRLLETLASQAVMVLEAERMTTEALESDRLRQEVAIGHTIQQTLLLGDPPDGLTGLQIATLSLPSQTIDGDFHDFISHGDHILDLMVGDVMGKGIPAALVGAATKGQLLRAAERFRFEEIGVRLLKVEEVINETHQRVTPQLISLDRFVTLFFARFDIPGRSVEFCDCGHTRTAHFSRSTGATRPLTSDNLPLGVRESEVYASHTVPFGSGDWFLLYSDGVTEARGETGELFGEERLFEFLAENRACPPKLLVRRLHQALLAHTGDHGFNDDVTCIAVKVPVGNLDGHIVGYQYIEADVERLEEVRNFVRDICRFIPDAFRDEDFIGQLELAANELFANIVEHALADFPGERVELIGRRSADCIVLEMVHPGEAFTPYAVTLPDIENTDAEGGFGLFIIENSVDEIGYLVETGESGQQCRIRLSKRFAPDAPANRPTF